MHSQDHSEGRAVATYGLADEPATLSLGERLAPLLTPGTVIHLRGDLGAGKTTLARGILRGLGFRGKVKSPTYTLVELYPLLKLNLYHFDFYRFSDPREWLDAGFRDYFNETSVCLIEWPEKAQGLLPAADLEVALSLAGSGREAKLTAYSNTGAQCLQRLQQSYEV